jgi:hypothetical protein
VRGSVPFEYWNRSVMVLTNSKSRIRSEKTGKYSFIPSCPAALKAQTTSLRALAIGGWTRTTPSSITTPILNLRAPGTAKCVRHGTGTTCGSTSQALASGKASIYRSTVVRLQAIGPATERTMSCPGLLSKALSARSSTPFPKKRKTHFPLS